MLFNSWIFVAFFLIVFFAYWRLPHRLQNLLLLAASFLFYGSWNYRLLPLLVVSSSVDYFAALGLVRIRRVGLRRAILLVSILLNFGLLGYFKYYNFFVTSYIDLMMAMGLRPSLQTAQIILPVGISFYTFQALSYTLDVYRQKIPAYRNYLDFLLFITYFPQLVAGPIERASDLLPRLTQPRRRLSTGQLVDGLKLILIGYFHKVAIADTVAPIVDRIFAAPEQRDALTLLVGVYGFSLQIYCDFSGYSKIARGVSRLLGVELMQNFEQPYLSRNLREFWRRWHISLSTWLRDYLYIPLGGNQGGLLGASGNLMATMLLGGLWHGASWNFVVWGGLHGTYLVAQRHFFRPTNSARAVGWPLRTAQTLLTFHLVALSWIFFRSKDWQQTGVIFRQLLGCDGRVGLEFVTIAGYLIMTLLLDGYLERFARSKRRHMLCLFSRRWWVETCVFTVLFLLVLLVGDNHAEPFLYFQF